MWKDAAAADQALHGRPIPGAAAINAVAPRVGSRSSGAAVARNMYHLVHTSGKLHLPEFIYIYMIFGSTLFTLPPPKW